MERTVGVFDTNDVSQKRREIEPLVRSACQQAVKQVVAVDKARCTQDFQSLETKKPARGRFLHPNGQRTESLRTGLSSELIVQGKTR